MTLQIRDEFLAQLKIDEGCKLKAYPDPISKGEPYTIGYGHTDRGVIKLGMVWTQSKADATLREDALRHASELVRKAPWILGLDPVRQDVLFNMAFNLGIEGLLGFRNTLNFIKSGDYAKASAGMLGSRWAEQVGRRAIRLATMMRTGIR